MPETDPKHQNQLRNLPSVDAVLLRLPEAVRALPHRLVTGEIRRVVEACRQRLTNGEIVDVEVIPQLVQKSLQELSDPSLRRVINATGVVLHTNLGRAPLGAVTVQAGYSNLEYDVEAGRRGRRDTHISALLDRLLDAPSIVVNNNAAAVYLVLNELAAGGEVIISRGELIEIGDGFRIPDIMHRAGVTIREVGTTNRTSVEDYRNAITPSTRLILRVHPSNFHIQGFTAKPSLQELTALSRECGVPVYEDLGSGCLVDLRAFGVDEPLVRDSLAAGVNVVSFSGDKLLGGSQAGFITGQADMVERIRRNPMFRAMRVDKLTTEVLSQKLRALLFENYDDVPALAMIRLTPEAIKIRAKALLAQAGQASWYIKEGRSVIGGGSTPEQSLGTWLLAIPNEKATAMEKRLRTGDLAVITRIEDNTILVDLRTVFPAEEQELLQLLLTAC